MFLGKRRTRFRIGPSRAKRFLKTFSVILLILISIYIFVPYSQEKDDVSAVVDPTIPSTITFTELNNVASITVKPSRVGAFVTTSGNDDIRFNITTTNYTGYTLTARSSKTTLDKGNDSLPTLTSAVTAEQFANSGNTPLSNRWGYKPNYFNSAPNSNYLPSPTSSGTILDATTEANSTAKNYNISLGARIDLSLPYGSYLNTVFSLEATANAVPYRIVFNGNGGDDTVAYLPSTMNSEAVTATAITLPNTIPVRQNHSFAGWCTVAPTRGTGGNETCSGTTYAAGDIYAIDYTGNNMGIVLYAIWTLNITCNISATTIATNNSVTDAVCIQDMNDTIAGTMNVGTNYRLIDVRDGTYYHLAKLLDGVVWMTDNLDLGRVNLTSDLTSSNTNLSTNVTAATFNGWRKSSGSSTYDAGEFINISGADSTSGTPYGTLYNYYATTAGTISGQTNSGDAIYDICPAGWRLPNYNSYGSFTNLYAQYNSVALMRSPIADSGAAIAFAGFFASGSPYDAGTRGLYWTSTYTSNGSAWTLDIDESRVSTGTGWQTSRGQSVRCVAKNPYSTLTISYGTGISSVEINGQVIADGGTISLEQGVRYSINATTSSDYTFNRWSATAGSLFWTGLSSSYYTMALSDATLTATATFTGTYIQNLDSSNCTSTASTVYDSRDMHTYTIQRLNDGNCWMMENLDLGRTGITTDLTSSNTNLATTVTAETFNSWKKTTGSATYDAGEYISVSGTDSTSGTAYGTLYNYYVASAGTISGGSNSSNAQYDICPAGWRLPTGGSSGEFQALYAEYNSNALMRASIENSGAAFALASYFNNATPANQGYVGRYWSSTRYSDSSMHDLLLSTSDVYPAGSRNRYIGLAIRCVLKKPAHTLTVSYGTIVSSVMINGQSVSNGGSITLEEGVAVSITMSPASNYVFSSWSATSGTIGSSNTQTTTYKIGTSNATLTVNAVFNGPVMQNLTASDCTSTARLALDTRDNHVYTIKRMNDGVCWMTENLELGATDLSVALTSANSNLYTTIPAATFNGWRKTSGSSTYTAGEYIQVSGNDAVNGSPYGVLYNYYAASGGTITGSTNTSDSTYDICPAGWRLPSATRNTGEFHDFANYYSTNTVLQQAVSSGGAGMTLSGTFTSSTPTSKDWLSSYWSSSVADSGCFSRNGKMLGFEFTNSNSTVYADACNDRASGHLIRCVLDESKISDLTYLQDFASLTNAGRKGVIASMGLGTQYQLTDIRDSKKYYIAKLADGNVWMTQNLDLDLETSPVNVVALTPANTDIPSNWTPSSATRTNTSWTFTTTAPQSYNPGTKYWNGNTHNGSGTSTSYISNSGTAQYHLGNYYNWTAAVALNNSSSYTTAGVLLDQSICPAGWTLPRGGYGASTYYTLSYQYSGNIWLSPTYFALSGTWGGSYDSVGFTAMYWATGAKNADRAYYADFSSDNSRNVGTGGYDRDMGLPVRCIARPAAAYITQ